VYSVDNLKRLTRKSSFPLISEFKKKLTKSVNADSVADFLGEKEEVRSGWSSRRDSQISEDDKDLIPKLSVDLQDYIINQRDKNMPKLLNKIIKTINDEKEVPSVSEMNIKICSAHHMFNTIMNNGDQILIFDMRTMYYHLRGHLDYNFKQDSNIPLPCDYLLENNLSIKDVYQWLP
jgi:hypothetical protein